MSESERSPLAWLRSIARLAAADRRRSSVTHQTQACVSRSVGIPGLIGAKRVAHLLQDAPREPTPGGRWSARHQLRYRTAALGDHDGRFRARDLIERPEAQILELPGRHGLHVLNIAMASSLCQQIPGSRLLLSNLFRSWNLVFVPEALRPDYSPLRDYSLSMADRWHQRPYGLRS